MQINKLFIREGRWFGGGDGTVVATINSRVSDSTSVSFNCGTDVGSDAEVQYYSSKSIAISLCYVVGEYQGYGK